MKAYRNKKIDPLVRDFVAAGHMNKISVADIGCYKRPMIHWLKKLSQEVDYVGVDEDPEALRYLDENGINGIDWRGYFEEPPRDFTLGLEVIEHIRMSETEKFLSTIRDRTRKAFFLTTPNFEGWDAKGLDQISRQDSLAEMRYVPDHLAYFDAKSDNPHSHKQAMTAESLERYFSDVLPAQEWEFAIIKAWPWKVSDMATGNSFFHFFKLHAVAWRPELFEKPMERVVNDLCSSTWASLS